MSVCVWVCVGVCECGCGGSGKEIRVLKAETTHTIQLWRARVRVYVGQLQVISRSALLV